MQHAFGLEIPTTLEDIADPKLMALLVYDMQVGILKQLPTAPQTLARAPKESRDCTGPCPGPRSTY